VFNRESQSANTARFQIGLAEPDAANGLLLTLMAFGLEARLNVTQVLFFKSRKNDVRLQHHSRCDDRRFLQREALGTFHAALNDLTTPTLSMN
jgi:hypothetical protein